MKTWLKFYLFFSLVAITACAKDDAAELRLASGLAGTWQLKMVNSNDHWGAPLYWHEVQSSKQVRFTANGNYYEKEDADSTFTLVATYQVLSEDEIAFTWVKPPMPEYPTYTLAYFFEPGNSLVLQKKQFEGVVAEKYVLAK